MFFFLYALRWFFPSLSWKKLCYSNNFPLKKQIGFGLITWVVAFPLAAFVEGVTDICVYAVFGKVLYDQVAALYLKMMASSYELLTIALVTILLLAPILEEVLFRGVLQTYLRRHFSPKGSIVLSSACFAFFHLAPSQGLGNFPLFFALMTLGMCLGFLYAKTSSLVAPISLHILFNTISSLYILLQ